MDSVISIYGILHYLFLVAQMAVSQSEIAVVGHFAIDRISLPGRSRPVAILGGSVTYVSLVAKRLNATVSIISNVGEDFPEAYMWWLKEEGVNLSNVKKIAKQKTTNFQLFYDNSFNRTLYLKSKSPIISESDLPSSLSATIVHLAPIAGEIPAGLIPRMKKVSQVLSLDPQGLLRRFDRTGKATLRPLIDNNMLRLIDIYKSSIAEIKILTRNSDLISAINYVHNLGVKTVIVTLGDQGSILSEPGILRQIPACSPRVIVDPTGAGDAFIGGFLTEYLSSKDAFWCACVGSAAASLVVEGIGPTFFGKKDEIYERARSVYEKEIKQ